MLHKRIIPVLLLKDGSLVKTIKFSKHRYIGDPCNTVKIFNELNADELIILDISKSKRDQRPDFRLISSLAKECFMPLTYGGGIYNHEDANRLFRSGVEKISINSSNFTDRNLIYNLACRFGSQALVGAIDIKRDFFGKARIWNHVKQAYTKEDPILYAKSLQDSGVGELLITSVSNEGTWIGPELETVKSIASTVSVPCIINGGVGHEEHIYEALDSEISAVGVSSYFLFQKKNFGVIVNFPDSIRLRESLFS